MEEMIYTITLDDGTILSNLRMSGNNFISETEVTEDIFAGNMKRVVISNGESEEILNQAELIQIAHYGDAGWYFILRETPADVLEKKRVMSKIDYLAMKAGTSMPDETKIDNKEYYNSGLWNEEMVTEAVAKGLATTTDVVELVGEDNAITVIRNAKIEEISAACNAVITAGFDIELAGNIEHFNLSVEDQSNIANLFRVVELGGTEFPYQADGGKCRIYTAQEIAQIYITAQTIITTQTTYHNALKAYVQSLTSVDNISVATYGMTLPKKYRDEMNVKLAVAQAQMEAIVARLNGQEG